MKRFFVLISVFLATSISSVFAYELEKIDLGGGKVINYLVSTDYSELEQLVFEEFHVRINIGQTSDWADNTNNNALSPRIRNMMRQYTQQGKFAVFAMAIFTSGDDLEEIFVNWCYRDINTGTYVFLTSYWAF
jgi:hypothetical protein